MLLNTVDFLAFSICFSIRLKSSLSASLRQHMSHTDGVPTTVHRIKGPLSSWAGSSPPSLQVGERAPVLQTNAPPTPLEVVPLNCKRKKAAAS